MPDFIRLDDQQAPCLLALEELAINGHTMNLKILGRQILDQNGFHYFELLLGLLETHFDLLAQDLVSWGLVQV